MVKKGGRNALSSLAHGRDGDEAAEGEKLVGPDFEKYLEGDVHDVLALAECLYSVEKP